MITVFTSCFNQGEYLADAVRSVLNQTEEDFEYLIYDDGSTDNTWNVIQSFNDPRIRSFKLEKHPNVATVINRSVLDSRGDFWVWCPSDDLLDRDCLRVKREFSQRFPEYVLYSEWHVVDETGSYVTTIRLHSRNPKDLFKASFVGSPIPFTGIWIPTCHLKTIPFPELLNYSEDYYWSVIAMIRGIRFKCIQIPLQYKRVHVNRTSNRHDDAIIRHLPTLRKELLEIATRELLTPGSHYENNHSEIVQAMAEINGN